MRYTYRIGALAALGLASAGLVGSLASGASASAATPATVDAEPVTALEVFGPYRSEGECNYWMYAVQAAGRRIVEPCHLFPAVGREYWFFHAA
jgi:hypothetical protein